MEMKDYEPIEFVYLIDRKFEKFCGQINRLDIKWGTWSREMNLVLKKKIAEEGPKSFVFGQVFTYWIIISQLLDLMYRCKGLRKYLLEKKIRNKIHEAKDVRNRISEST